MIKLKNWCFIIVFILLFIAFTQFVIFAQELSIADPSYKPSSQQLSRVYICQDIELSELSCGASVFFFSKLKVSGEHDGNLIVIGGKTHVSGTVSGVIYSVGAIISFDYTAVAAIKDYTFLPLRFFVVLGFVNFVFGIILLSMFKNFFEQGAAIAVNEPLKIIKYGTAFYAAFISLILIFALSIAGFPVALFIMVLFIIFSSVGQISLCLFMAYWVCIKFGMAFFDVHTFSLYFVGSLLIESIKCIPVFGSVFMFLLVPVLSLGFLSKTTLNRKLFRLFYDIPFKTSLETHFYDRDVSRNVILQGVKKKTRG